MLGILVELTTFNSALKKGLGRAYTFLKENGDKNYEEPLLYYCLHNPTWDPQSEGSRAEWIYSLLQLTNNPQSYYEKIIDAISNTTEDWDIYHLTTLCKLISKSGNNRAKEALYQKFDLLDCDITYHLGEAIVDLDKFSGLMYIANVLGRQLLEKKDGFFDDALYDNICEKLGKKAVKEFLKESAKDNKNIKAYLTAAQDIKKLQQRPSRQTAKFNRILKYIEEGSEPLKYLTMRYGEKHASEEQIKIIFHKLLDEKRKDQIIRCLYFFTSRPFPFLHEKTLDLALSGDNQIKEAAIKAISNSKDPAIRKLVTLIYQTEKVFPHRYLTLFILNYQPGDHHIIEAAIINLTDEQEIHNVCYALIDICKNNMSAELMGCLIWVYENSPCSVCRNDAVVLLKNNLLLPNELQAEYQFDCFEYSKLDVQN